MPTDTAAPEGQSLTTTQPTPRQAIVVDHVQPIFDTGRFEQMQRAARALMHSTLLPESIRGTGPESCFSNLMVIFDYADRWKVPAVMLAQCVSIVHNKLMFEGKAVAAALETTLGVKLDYEWTGSPGGDDYAIRVFGTRPGEDTPREIRGTVGQWKTKGQGGAVNPNWVGANATMQLAYRGAREWARLWAPGTMLGVYGDDEMDAFEERRVSVLQDAPRITSGFAAPKVEPNVDADGVVEEVQDAEVEEVVDATVEETQQPQADVQAEPDPKPKPKKAKAPAEPQETPEERAERIWQEGHAVGLAGGDNAPPKGLAGTDLDNWTMGFHAGAAEAMDDQADTGAADDEDSDGESDGEMDAETQADLREAAENFLDDMAAPIDPFAAFMEGIRSLDSWADIKAGLSALSRSDEWKVAIAEAGAPRVRQARITAWLRTEELRAKGKEKVDVINDLTAFRCWAETTEDPDAIAGNWRVLVDQPVYQALAPEQRKKLESVVMARMKELREPSMDV